MDALSVAAASDSSAMKTQSQGNLQEQLLEVISRGTLDFDSWTLLVSEVEKTYPDKIEAISLVYDAFLYKFPLCHLHWKKYAYLNASLCTIEKAVEIFERAVQSVTHSVGFWVEYCGFAMSVFEDPFDVRRLFKRAISVVGKDYLCHTLWDKYIKFEFSQQQWSYLAHIHLQSLRFPTRKLHNYYDNFKQFVVILEEEIKPQYNSGIEVLSEAVLDAASTVCNDQISVVINKLQDPSDGSVRSNALCKYVAIGELFYKKSCQLDEKIHYFEAQIRRLYFHVKPLDDKQLENWHLYLDFIEKQNDFDWAVKLYERCLIPCANYPEYWMRYVGFVEAKGGLEIAKFALDRATQIFLRDVPAIHRFDARFKEKIGDVQGARAAFLQCATEFNPYFIDDIVKEANMENRQGNLAAASDVYEKALKMVSEKPNLHRVQNLYIHFSRLKYMITGSPDAAMGVIIEGIHHSPHCRTLIEELIRFAMMHGGSSQVNVVDAIVARAISPQPDASDVLAIKDREDISCSYLEFVDFCGTIHDVLKAWNRHIRLFPHLTRMVCSFNHPTSDNQIFDLIRQERLMGLSKVPNQRSGDSSHQLILPPAQEKEQLVSENIQLDQVVAEQSITKDSDNDLSECMQQLSPEAAKKTGSDACSVDGSSYGLVHQHSNDASGLVELSHDLVSQDKEDAEGSLETSIEQKSRPQKASQEYTDPLSIEEKHDHEFEQHLKPISLESLSLNSQEKEYQDISPVASERDGSAQEFCTFNGSISEICLETTGQPSTANPKNIPEVHSDPDEHEGDEHDSVDPSTSSDLRIPAKLVLQPQLPANSGENWHQINSMATASADASSGFQGNSGEQQHQQLHNAAEVEPQVPPSQNYPHHSPGWQNPQSQKDIQAQNHCQTRGAQANAWLVHDRPLQSSVTVSQSQLYPQHISHTQGQSIESTIESTQQIGPSQDNQAYSHVTQCHYHQHHLQQQYQLGQLQTQQPYFQLQQQYQPYRQQQTQQKYQQPNQQQYQFVPQQHQPTLSNQHSQQLWAPHQQHQLYVVQEPHQLQQQQQWTHQLQTHQAQQQQYYRIEQLAVQQLQQGFQQQAEQRYQLMLQHYQLQQQQYQQQQHQWPPQQHQHQQQPPQEHQYDQEQQQSQHQTTPSHNRNQ